MRQKAYICAPFDNHPTPKPITGINQIMNNPFENTAVQACDEAFRTLCARIEALKQSPDAAVARFCSELEEGKMLGVLIAADDAGETHTLYAFSGQIGRGGFHFPGFVGPVFDYLPRDGYFKTKEAEISLQNSEIARFERDVAAKIRADYSLAEKLGEAEIARYKDKCRQSKQQRAALRDSAEADEAELIRQSQFEKAELHRLKKKVAAQLAPLKAALLDAETYLKGLKDKRRRDSEALQTWLFTNFRLLNARGESRSLSEIFANTPMKIPPSGTGECCAPKLLQAAYIQGLTPLAISEYWYGRPKEGELRIHGNRYPACRGKCLPVLGWMLRGLEVVPPLGAEESDPVALEPKVIFQNEWFCVVDKPAGMLSVPGKGPAVSVQQWLEERFGSDKEIKMAHRLDRDTSGLLIATFGHEAYKLMQSLFATRKVTKTYIADLEGDFEASAVPPAGRISLPISPDWLDRPRQRIDFEEGKEAVTDYRFLSSSGGVSRVLFHPLTGRTHQLRVHAASEQGLSMPIIGDRLYGRNTASPAPRLRLHAHRIEFTFPLDGKRYRFESPVLF